MQHYKASTLQDEYEEKGISFTTSTIKLENHGLHNLQTSVYFRK